MFLVELALVVIGGLLIGVTLLPFSPITLKAYMPSRSTMITIHRNRSTLRIAGAALLAVMAILIVAGASAGGWWWALGGTVAFLGMFFWGMYVPVIMRPPPVMTVLTAEEADRKVAADLDVLGVEVNGETRAYPRGQLARPHVAFDSIGGEDIAVTYCILCNTAVGFKAEFEGKPMHFRAITAFNNNIIYYDAQRQNYIQQLDGQVVSGPDTGKAMDSVPISITSWAAWRDAHPDTVLVDLPPTGFRDKMMSTMLDWMIPLHGLSKRKSPWHPMSGDLDSRLPAMAMVVGVESGEERRAYPLDDLRERHVVNDELGGVPIVLIHDAHGDAVGVFRRDLDGETLTFDRGGEAIAIDDQGGRSWTVRGEAIGSATRLEPFPHFGKLFWFSWANFNPDTKVSTH